MNKLKYHKVLPDFFFRHCFDQGLAWYPKFCLNFFSSKIILFKDFCRNSIEISKEGPKEIFLRNVSEFSPKNFVWSPFGIFYRKIFPGGLHPTCTLPLRNLVLTQVYYFKEYSKFAHLK